jgi:hypothetical protein
MRRSPTGDSIHGVRSVAGCFFIIGWIMLVVGGLAALAVLGSIGNTPGGIAGAMLPFGAALAASLSPFFLWAVLRALIASVDAQTDTADSMRSLLEVQRANLATLQEATGVTNVTLPAVNIPQNTSQASTMPNGVCPSCGWDNPSSRHTCNHCGSPLNQGTEARAPSLPQPQSSTTPIATTRGPRDQSATCPGCGWRNSPGWSTCQQCGVAL